MELKTNNMENIGIKEIEKLLEYYQLPINAPSNDLKCCIAEILDFTLHVVINRSLEEVEAKEKKIYSELKELIRFISVCKGGEITMVGTAKRKYFDINKGYQQSIKISETSVLDALEKTAKEYLLWYKIESPFINGKEMALTGNKLLGLYASELLYVIESYELGEMTKTKKYSFIYDLMLLENLMVGNTRSETIIEKGFKSKVGKEKSRLVTNWLNAYGKGETQVKV